MRHATALLTALILLCALPAATAQVRHEIRFPDLPDYRTLKCDFHIHTVFSDGLVWPTVRIDAPAEALSAGLS